MLNKLKVKIYNFIENDEVVYSALFGAMLGFSVGLLF